MSRPPRLPDPIDIDPTPGGRQAYRARGVWNACCRRRRWREGWPTQSIGTGSLHRARSRSGGTEAQAKSYGRMRDRRYPGTTYIEVASEAATIVNLAVALSIGANSEARA